MRLRLLTMFLLATAVIFLPGCETEIPEVDVTDPTFTFRIQGPGINKTYDQDTDFSAFQLNLKSNAQYNFTYFGSDDGGVEHVSWQADVLTPADFSDVVPEDVVITDLQLSTLLTIDGTINAPVSSLGMNGKLHTGSGDIFGLWRFFVSDYGGQSGSPNEVYREMSVFLTNSGPFGEQSLD